MCYIDIAGVVVWEASYLPFGDVRTSTGPNINLRFPGQWFQSEAGLHQNWMRDYDPTIGRYIQADPLGLVDGASIYGYVRQNPGRFIDPTGEVGIPGAIGGAIAGGVAGYISSDGCIIATLGAAGVGGVIGAASINPLIGGAGAAALGQIVSNELSCYCNKQKLPFNDLMRDPQFWGITAGGAVWAGAAGAAVNNAKHVGVYGSEILGPRLGGFLKEVVIGSAGGVGEYIGQNITD